MRQNDLREYNGPEGSQDRKELADLAELYIPIIRCEGGRLTHENYLCFWCGRDPSFDKCPKPGRRR